MSYNQDEKVTVDSQQRSNTQQSSNIKRPEAYGFWKTVVIVLCGHLGVRTTEQRKTDFARANGVHVFAVAVLYFLLINIALIILVNVISG
ncbi:MAG: DUF2970 domain-containing protein [Porticoccaceae bacterium]|nr:DUF2970 domain-containing protein [Porticoccaceae bacterium]